MSLLKHRQPRRTGAPREPTEELQGRLAPPRSYLTRNSEASPEKGKPKSHSNGTAQRGVLFDCSTNLVDCATLILFWGASVADRACGPQAEQRAKVSLTLLVSGLLPLSLSSWEGLTEML